MAPYTGRFAPTPSGQLHFGSVVTALGSYLRARSLNGRFILRIEDLDTPRCHSEFIPTIIEQLHALGFEFDGLPIIQSQQKDLYIDAMRKLVNDKLAFYCTCTRAYLKSHVCTCATKSYKDDELRDLLLKPHSIRFKGLNDAPTTFHDELLGDITLPKSTDFLSLMRADGIISYNLACVVDDIDEGITEIVRGADILDVTPRQLQLYEAFKVSPPHYVHLPLVISDDGLKLSKQNHAKPAFELASPSTLLIKALEFLGQETFDLNSAQSCKNILKIAIYRFNLQKIPQKASIFTI